MKVYGPNKFKLPHMKKGRWERQGQIQLQVHCEATLVNEVMEKLATWNI
jgi:hypothetical protein